MWTRYIPYLLELAAAGGLLFFFAFVSWTKLALGAALTAAGAFFPHAGYDKTSAKGTLKVMGANVTLVGSLRVAVAIGGVVLLVGEGFTSKARTDNYKQASSNAAAEMNALFGKANKESPSLYSLPIEERVSKLTELRDSLKMMQSLRPDPHVESALATIEKFLQANISVLSIEKDIRKRANPESS
jgi:hypothetical protein